MKLSKINTDGFFEQKLLVIKNIKLIKEMLDNNKELLVKIYEEYYDVKLSWLAKRNLFKKLSNNPLILVVRIVGNETLICGVTIVTLYKCGVLYINDLITREDVNKNDINNTLLEELSFNISRDRIFFTKTKDINISSIILEMDCSTETISTIRHHGYEITRVSGKITI